MILNFEQIQSITQGAERVEKLPDGYHFYRFRDGEAPPKLGPDTDAGIQMYFKTDAEALRLKVRVFDEYCARRYFSFDVFSDEERIGSLRNFPDEDINIDFTEIKYPQGSFEGDFPLVDKNAVIRIVFPNTVTAEVEEIELVGASYVTPFKWDKILLAHGDSITHGMDGIFASNTYISKLAYALGCELYNKGIGGAKYNPALVESKADYVPDYITVAYGTNDWWMTTEADMREKCREFLSRLLCQYPTAKIFVLSPIWRRNYLDEREFGDFFRVELVIKEICQELGGLIFIRGWDLVPHDASCFGDTILHPNDKGYGYYYENLLKEIKKHI